MFSPPAGRIPAAVAVVLAFALVAGCSGSGSPKALPTTTVPVSTTTTSTSTTTTTVALPPDPQTTPLQASTVFINDWKRHDQAAAAQVATPAAVQAIFAVPYTTQSVISRGCSVEFTPRKCSWGPPGGGAGSLYQIELMPDGANWYVSAASIES